MKVETVMLQASSNHKLPEVEAALRRAAHRYGATVQPNVHHVGHLLRERDAAVAEDAMVFTICHHELFAALLGADIRVSAFLPCRVAAYSRGGQVMLEAMSPVEFGRLLHRPDLVQLAAPLEDLLRGILEDAAQPQPASSHPAPGLHPAGLGATEEQMNLRGSLPQRIDTRGTKIEDLGGTGQHDSQGG